MGITTICLKVYSVETRAALLIDNPNTSTSGLTCVCVFEAMDELGTLDSLVVPD